MTKIDIISGFLGAGKTTLINRLINEGFNGEKIVLIENEFGEIGIDGGFLKESGVEIAEMNSGCICCSLVGDFSRALKQVVADFSPDRIIIEPSGVGKLSDVTRAVIDAKLEDVALNSSVAVVDVNKCKMYMKNFGEFFNDQISHAGCIFFSHTDKTTENKLKEALELVRQHNGVATIVTTPADKLDIKTVIEAMENKTTLEAELQALVDEENCPICRHHHHDHHHSDECCEHHHDHDHHHDHKHEHHDCDCENDHDHHHHADEVFTSWGAETVRKYTVEEITHILSEFDKNDKYGNILRAKGYVDGGNGSWIYFDYIPEEPNVREGAPAAIGKICVIGAELCEKSLAGVFMIKE